MCKVLQCSQQLPAVFVRGVKDLLRHEGDEGEEVEAATVGHEEDLGCFGVHCLGQRRVEWWGVVTDVEEKVVTWGLWFVFCSAGGLG